MVLHPSQILQVLQVNDGDVVVGKVDSDITRQELYVFWLQQKTYTEVNR